MRDTQRARELPSGSEPPLGPWPGAFFDVPGGRLHFRRVPGPAGEEPAVFVHGLAGSAANWTDLAWLLADTVDGFAIDLPGFGESGPPATGRYSLATHVAAVSAVVDQLGAPVHLFGNSLGGAVCVRLAAQRPDLVRTLTLVSPAMPDLAVWHQREVRLGLLLVPGLRTLMARRLARVAAERRADATLALCYARPERVSAARKAELVAAIRARDELPHSQPAMLGSLAGLVRAQLAGRSLWAQAAAIRAPTLVVWGRLDRLVHPSLGQRLAGVIPRAKLVMLDDCGHVAQLEAPQLVASAWREFARQASSDAILSPGTYERERQ